MVDYSDLIARQNMGASSDEDRAVVNGAGQAVSAVPASVPSAAEWPIWEVRLDGFEEVFVQAPSAKSARWWAASRCHKAGYGRSAIDLIRRGISVHAVPRTFAEIMGGIHRVIRKAA